jgi:hypothetical protein
VTRPTIENRTREAVELWYENGLTVEYLDGMTYNHRVALVEAARRWADLTIVCPTCGGSGRIEDCGHGPMVSHATDCGTRAMWPCPDCRGGVQLNPDKVEAAAKAGYEASSHALPWHEQREVRRNSWRIRTAAALWAAIEGDPE